MRAQPCNLIWERVCISAGLLLTEPGPINHESVAITTPQRLSCGLHSQTAICFQGSGAPERRWKQTGSDTGIATARPTGTAGHAHTRPFLSPSSQ
ncbi:hypothetical protein AAFF_G00003530 [Aldrovandia affinis]|uniref:Uncharacterized protein n=1 Tax=Aldrovandia affinis TaxID=143900 RepID=A0AAD7TDA1_9TELE|nr:hypothetical protein AAFF_G00003530 [Aldrovandia affinis]